MDLFGMNNGGSEGLEGRLTVTVYRNGAVSVALSKSKFSHFTQGVNFTLEN